MKILSASLIISLIAINMYGQASILKLYAYDTAGNTDTLLFGLKNDSTIGVDSLLGEVNLYGVPVEGLDIRIRQRDSSNFSCGQIASLDKQVYWSQNIESKIDLRPYIGFEGFQNNTFELFIHCENYPLNITIDNSEIGFMSDHILLTGKTIDCDEYFVLGNLSSDQNFVTDETTAGSPILFLSFESYDENYYIVGAEKEELIDKNILNIYPNPAIDKITIESKRSGKIILSNAIGQYVFESQIDEDNKTIDVTDLESGLYFLHYWNIETGTFECKTFIKKQL